MQLDYTALEGGANPSSQVLSISNAEVGSLSWTIEEDSAWLSLSRYSGVVESGFTSMVVVTVDPAGLGPGVYTCDMIVRSDGAAGSPQVVTVNLDVVGPRLEVSALRLDFTAMEDGVNPGEQVFTIANTGGGSFEWAIDGGQECGWLGVEPVAGLLGTGEQDEVVVSVDTSGLDTGTYDCALTVSSAGADNSPALIPVTLSINRPKYSGGSGTVEDPYQIWDAYDLNAIGLHPEDWAKSFVLMADIDVEPYLSVYGELSPIGNIHDPNAIAFTGSFDGNAHIIRGLQFEITEGKSAALFVCVIGGEIKDLGLLNCSINAENVENVGMLVGQFFSGAIRRCFVSDSLVRGKDFVGGMVGYNINGAVSDCYSKTSVHGLQYVGGLVGQNIHGRISNSFSAGLVEGQEQCGGLVGSDVEGLVCYSFWDREVSFQDNSAGGSA